MIAALRAHQLRPFPLDLAAGGGTYTAWGCTRAGGGVNGRPAATVAYRADWRDTEFAQLREREIAGFRVSDCIVDGARLVWVGKYDEGRWFTPDEFQQFATDVAAFAAELRS